MADDTSEKELAAAASIMGRRGGKARAAALSPDRRREIATIASHAAKANIEQKREAGKKGGSAAAALLTPEQRRERAIRAVQARQAREAAMTPEQRQELLEKRRARAQCALQAREAKRMAAAATINTGEES